MRRSLFLPSCAQSRNVDCVDNSTGTDSYNVATYLCNSNTKPATTGSCGQQVCSVLD